MTLSYLVEFIQKTVISQKDLGAHFGRATKLPNFINLRSPWNIEQQPNDACDMQTIKT